ncbi:MAG: bifunctional fructose-bisphosphatase/inositol-phosphate phosphatase [Methanosarcinaceae archaeon]|nr:bifunctional fructose-bisphosphatase/inositol-phosphate phosphatase [Methanosarcinaceae archaeon]
MSSYKKSINSSGSVPSDEILLKLCRKIANSVKESIHPVLGKDSADDFMFIGADGTDTKRIDLIAENEALRLLKEFNYPMKVISEEAGEVVFGTNPNFSVILDPLDGTNNAVLNIPFYSISIAFAKPDLTGVFFGYIKSLANNDEFYAFAGKGAYMNGKKIESSSVSAIKELTVSAYGFRQNKDRATEVCSRVRKMRVLGSVALELGYVAAGKIDAFIDVRSALRLVDVAAGQLIIKEAGGIVSDGYGNPLSLPDNLVKPVNLVASNGVVHKDILNMISYSEITCRGDKVYYKGLVKKIAIVSRCDSSDALNMVKEIVEEFSDDVEIFLSSSPARLLDMPERGISVKKMEEEGIDLVLSVGGDGTILRNMSKMNDPIPMLGIHMGTLGFLVDVLPENAIETIRNIIKSGFYYDERPRIDVFVNGKFVGSSINELVTTSAHPAKIVTYEIFVDDSLLSEIRADGIVFATPTGSTAYAMSAGGPILSPEVDAIVIVPIAPFKLSSRPWVVSFDSEIQIRIKVPDKEAVLVIDGKETTLDDSLPESEQTLLKVSESDTIRIKRARYPGRFIQVTDACFYEKVRNKLSY